MAGETNLSKLLSSMAPKLLDGEYVFCSVKAARYGDLKELEPLATYNEAEGLTLLVPKHLADENGLSYESVFRGITLAIHSSLDAVGLTAAVSTKLAEHGISANVIAAYYHDHLFVQTERAEQAIAALRELAE
ncbi:MAG: ACT domain-containing protein [Cyanobacteria bacterium J06635_1]